MLCFLIGDVGRLLVTEARSQWPSTVSRAVPTTSTESSCYTVRTERTTKPLLGPSTQGELREIRIHSPTESLESKDFQAKTLEITNKLSLASSLSLELYPSIYTRPLAKAR